jgi:hypothetical protein
MTVTTNSNVDDVLARFGIPLTGANPPIVSGNPTSRKTFPMGPLAPPTSTVIQAVTAVNSSSSSGTTSSGVPNPLLSLSGAESPIKQQTQTYCEVTLTFSVDASDTNYDHVDVWMIGYHGSGVAQLIASGKTSPIDFQLDSTQELVTFYVQTVSADGQSANYLSALSTNVTLSGVVSTPPAPTVSQTLVGTPLGYQFSFNQIVLSAGTQDIITAYRVYRNSTNTFSGATLQQTFVHDPTHSGAIVFQDNVGGGQTYYYFVTSVNSAGYESTDTAAQSGTVTSGTATLGTDVVDGTQNFSSTASALTYRPTSNPLTATDAGSTATVNVASFTLRTSSKGDVNVNSGSVTALSYSTLYYIYYDDATLAGATVTFNATTTKSTAINGVGRIFIGSIITPAATAPNTIGNNDGGVGAQAGQTSVFLFGTSTATVTGGATNANPKNAIDGDLTTFAKINIVSTAATQTASLAIAAASPSSAPWTSLTLYIRSAVPSNTVSTGSTTVAQMQVNVNGSLTTVYTLGYSTTRAVTVDSVSLPVNTNLALVTITGSLSKTDATSNKVVEMDIYEVWVVGQQ